jgi:hypothetical protein
MSRLPTGTVTLLLTDIEGSTTLRKMKITFYPGARAG